MSLLLTPPPPPNGRSMPLMALPGNVFKGPLFFILIKVSQRRVLASYPGNGPRIEAGALLAGMRAIFLATLLTDLFSLVSVGRQARCPCWWPPPPSPSSSPSP
jgi:hypothetical protein